MRRRQHVTRQPPLDRLLPYLNDAVVSLRKRVTDRERLGITQQELLEMFVPVEHRSSLVAASTVIRRPYNLSYDYQVQWRGRAAVSFTPSELPEYKILTIADIHRLTPWESDIAPRIDAWLDRRLELAREFGRVVWLLGQLNDQCKTLGQVRYYWPAILTLCAVSPQLTELGERLQTAHGGSAPPLPLNVRNVCGLAAGTVTAASLLDDNPVPDDREVRVEFMQSNTWLEDEHAGCKVPTI